jgi:predicted TIM-barrel fold metal-dependent hydrolase
VDGISFVDTHEHLWEESKRLSALEAGERSNIPAPDFGILTSHYSDSDLQVAGMPNKDLEAIQGYTLTPAEKWKLLAPWYALIRHTGYGRCMRESVRALYGVDDLRDDSVEIIAQKMRAAIVPGFYKTILRDVCKIEYAQVNSLEKPLFMETAQPDLLAQDLSTVPLCTNIDIDDMPARANIEVANLRDWHRVIDWAFDTYGPRAIATKNQCAYERALNFDRVKTSDAAPLFDEYRRKGRHDMRPEDFKAIQDHLFHYCIDQAADHNLVVKLHTGYYAGQGSMPLSRLRTNAGDCCDLLMAHRNARFDFFHIAYPYQDEMIAIAKQHPNAYVDLCWAWIINPTACVRFLKEFITAAPANKLVTFGGDMMPIELVPGHAAVARQGIAQALHELLEEDWLTEADIEPLAQRLMNGSAHELFDGDRALAGWKK